MAVTADPRLLESLRVEITQSRSPRPTLPIPDNASDPTLIEALRDVAETRFGAAGQAIDKAVTFYDLFRVGLMGVVSPDGTLITAGLPSVGGGFVAVPIGSDPIDDVAPPAPTGLTAVSGIRINILQWNEPDNDKVGLAEVWSNSVDNLGTAVKIGQTSAFLYQDEVNAPGVARYYWVRFVNRRSPFLTGPFNNTLGTLATTGTVANADLANLIVSAEKLSQGTYPNINLVPNPGAEDGVVAWSTAWDTGLGTFTVDTSTKTGGAQAFKLTKANGTRAGVGCLALPVIPGETYAWRLKWKGSTAIGGSHYVRMYEAATKPVGGYVTGGGAASVTELVASGPITTAFVEVKGTYLVPAGVFWVSLGVLNDIASANLDLWWDDVSLGRQITAEFLAANSIAVGTAAIQNAAIVNAMIGVAAVDTANIANAAIVTAKIADANVTTAKIADLSVTTAKIADANITTAKIGSLEVTNANIATGAITNAKINDLSADKINAGAIRGINVNAASHTTIGSYLTSAPAGGAGTLDVKDTTDFPSSGSGFIVDTTNDRDAISWTGKTSTTLTGCTGVLAHNNGATIIPASKAMIIDAATNEMRFYGNRGDGTIVELASLGFVAVGVDQTIGKFGDSGFTTGFAVYAENSSNVYPAIKGVSTQAQGVVGISTDSDGVFGQSTNSWGVHGLSTAGVGAFFDGFDGQVQMPPLSGRPAARPNGCLSMINTTGGFVDGRTATPRLMYCDGTDWRRVADDTIFTG